MKTPMQELLEWVRATLPMDLDTPQMIEQKIKSMLDVEKEQIRTILLAYQEDRNDRSDGAQNWWEPYEVDDFLEKYNETFNTNEK